MFEFFIAKRYLRSKHKLNFITIISVLSTLGITIGVAALVIVLSVFNGFGSIVKNILVNFDPHVRVSIISEDAYSQIDTLTEILKDNENVKRFYPFVEGKVVLLKGKTYEVVNLKGISQNDSTDEWGVESSLFAGSANLTDNSRIDEIILGLPIALRLTVRIGDTVLVSSFNNIENTLLNFAMPVSRPFIVKGIFKTNNKDYDLSLVFTSLKSGQSLLSMNNNISGYEIRLNDIDESAKVKSELKKIFNPEQFTIRTWYDLHRDLYTVMIIERWSAYIILCLIIAVATFNILGSLTMSVIEKRKDIGILRSMGVSDKSILKIFMFEGLLIGLIGTIAGTLIGLAVYYVQLNYNVYPLDASKYIIDSLPVKLLWTDLAAISGMSILLSFLASLYPAKRAVKLSITDAVKWE